jgi:hypothetical protein
MSVLPGGTVSGGVAPTPPREGTNATPPDETSDPIVAIGRTVSEAAGAMAELHEVFERLRSLLVVARDEHATEVKIGELFVRAQDHVNHAVADAEERTRQLLADAELEASRIVMAAKQEAHRLLEEARQPAIPPAVTDQLQKTIEGFARVNGELQSELTSLVQTLTEKVQRPPSPPVGVPSPPVGAPPPPPPPPGYVGGHDRDGVRALNAPPPPVATPAPGQPAPSSS